ncbi:enoyl-CoA hydratase/isomerase family protein [Microbacterium oxydans]|uniref:enoyl-CoA hydratase/isomerase family protein n=1 Tax=Microbacterium oxydans TaxID=82380 RepID=UPI00226B1378|nr:enoyl-CoA hydratase/isomerase family protein [Microbacterium oxydans]WAA65629.1 enoyl-CoA hydratase/isomerase family protein [Microbacterium oxydans]
MTRITLIRPSRRNALTAQMLRDLISVFQHPPRHQRGVIIHGSGGAFCAGADIEELNLIGASADPTAGAEGVARMAKNLMALIEASPVPVIACVDGPAVGGGLELALACDWIHATDRSSFALPETTLGLIPGFGGTRRIVERAGVAVANEMILGDLVLDAHRAREAGLVSHVHESHQASLDAATASFTAGRPRSPHAIALAREVLRVAVDSDRATAFTQETAAYGRAFAHPDGAHGMTAFLEKRVAEFGRDA